MSQVPFYPRWASGALKLPQGAYVNLGNDARLSNLTAFTLEAWVMLAETDLQGTVYLFYKGGSTADYTLYIVNGCLHFNMGSMGFSNSSKQMPAGQWLHISVVIGPSENNSGKVNAVIYCNDTIIVQSINSFPSAIPQSDSNLIIGGTGGQGPASVFGGSIRSVIMWGSARTQAELLTDSLNTTGAFFALSNVVDTPGQQPTYDLTQINPLFAIDFSVLPAVDLSGNNTPVGFEAGAMYEYSVPAASFSGSTGAYITVNPNDGQYEVTDADSFTVDGWFFTDKTGITQTLVFNGGDGSPQYAVVIGSDSRLTGYRGTEHITSSEPLETGVYYHFALAYNANPEAPDQNTLSLYINGNLQGKVLVAGGVPTGATYLLVGAANNASGHTTDAFSGNIQSINIWSVGHSQAEVRQWMYNQMITDDTLLAAFDFSVSEPQLSMSGIPVMTDLGSAPVDTANEATLVSTAGFDVKTWQITPGDRAWGMPLPINASYLYSKDITIPNNIPVQGDIAIQPVAFSAGHKEASWNAVQSWLHNGQPKEEVRKQFEAAFAQAQQFLNNNPRLQQVVTRIDEGGITKLIYHGLHRDQVILTAKTGLINDCTLWWIGFVTHLTVGFLEALGLFPSVEGVAEKVYLKIVKNKKACQFLAKMTAEVITVSSAIDFFGVLYDEDLLWGILKLLLATLGWWALTKVLVTIVGLLTGLEAAALLVGFGIWAAQLIIMTLDYQGACGNSGPPVKTS